MRINMTQFGVELIRDKGDKALSHESAATRHLLRLVREKTGRRFVRFRPDREELTVCRQGIIDRATGECYWHERYSIEEAHKAFNSGGVYYQKG